jgi:hypothetical protein
MTNNGFISSYDREWRSKSFDQGKTEIRHCISERLDRDGNKFLHIEDISTTRVKTSIEKCVALMKDGSKHKKFTGDYHSETIRTLSDNKWIIYYYTKNPWPIANSDCVLEMTLTRNVEEKSAAFTLIAAPSAVEKGEVDRMGDYNVTYSFREIGTNLVEITIIGKSSPPEKVPIWLVKAAFPAAPANALRRFVKLLEEN